METKVQQDLRLSPKGAPELGFKLGLVDSASTRCFPSHLSAPKSVGKALSPLSKPLSETSGRGSLFHEGVCGRDMSAFFLHVFPAFFSVDLVCSCFVVLCHP